MPVSQLFFSIELSELFIEFPPTLPKIVPFYFSFWCLVLFFFIITSTWYNVFIYLYCYLYYMEAPQRCETFVLAIFLVPATGVTNNMYLLNDCWKKECRSIFSIIWKFNLDTCNLFFALLQIANSQLYRVELVDLEVKHDKSHNTELIR